MSYPARPAAIALILIAAAAVSPRTAVAQITADHRRELGDISRELREVPKLIGQDEFDEAEKLLDAAATQLDKIQQDAGLQPTDRVLLPARRLIEQHRGRLLQQRGVSFSDHVLPILKANCTSCHGGDNPRAGLNLESYEGLQKGGQGGALLTVGNANPQRSRIMFKLLAPDNQKMPPGNRPRLDAEDIQMIGLWITQGAKNDGAPAEQPKPVEIPMATGNEKVSFTRDIAPFMVNLCLGCHGGNNPRSGLSLETFEKIMQGGDSGEVIIPGDRENSRLFRLVGGLENPRMPQGQGRITRQNYEDLKTWFDEGNKYDGKDPKIALRELVPSAAELAAERLAKMTPEEFAQLRIQRSEAAWKRAISKEPHQRVDAEETVVFGNVPEARLQEVSGWAEEHVKTLRRVFNESDDGRLWRGRLAVFVVKDRFGFEEFNIVLERRENVPNEMTGYSTVTNGMEDAYVVLQDIGDEATDTAPGLQTNLIDHMTGAYLKRAGSPLPDWVVRGTGLALASQADSSNAWFRQIRRQAPEILRTVTRPQDIFANGTFSPAAVGPVGYTLVEYMMKSGGAPKFGQFIRALQGGADVPTALRTVYGTDMATLGRAYAASLR